MSKSRILGFKAFESNLSCLGYKFEIGKTYEHEGKIVVCKKGFHFCKSLTDCYRYYPMHKDTRICKVEALGDVLTEDNIKYVTNKIKILSEVKNPSIASNLSKTSSGFCNTGEYNNGNMNTGDHNDGSYNSGDYNSGGSWNSGDFNSGSWNSGIYNSGVKNSGRSNSGSYNSGDFNSGDYNSGDYNSGDCNSGDWNSSNYNSGIFNTTISPKITMFNKISNWTYDDWRNSRAYNVMRRCPCDHTKFINIEDMSDQEKEVHPEYKLLGGYLKTHIISWEERQNWWDHLDDYEKRAVMTLPNFDPAIFKVCTGIQV